MMADQKAPAALSNSELDMVISSTSGRLMSLTAPVISPGNMARDAFTRSLQNHLDELLREQRRRACAPPPVCLPHSFGVDIGNDERCVISLFRDGGVVDSMSVKEMNRVISDALLTGRGYHNGRQRINPTDVKW